MMLVKENLPIIIDHHPFHESLNTKILNETANVSYEKGGIINGNKLSNVRASKTTAFKISSSSIEVIYEWILNILRSRSKTSFCSLTIPDAWLANYSVKEFAVSHGHPSPFSFVYFVRCPKGSSPLIFTTSGKKIKAEEGKVVIIPGNLLHHVPENKCDGRITLAGNINVRWYKE